MAQDYVWDCGARRGFPLLRAGWPRDQRMTNSGQEQAETAGEHDQPPQPRRRLVGRVPAGQLANGLVPEWRVQVPPRTLAIQFFGPSCPSLLAPAAGSGSSCSSEVAPGRSPTPGSARPSPTGSPSGATSSRSARTPTVSPPPGHAPSTSERPDPPSCPAPRHRSRRRRCHQGPAGDSGSARVRRSSSPSSRSTMTRRSAWARGGNPIKASWSVSRAETTSQHGQSAHGTYNTLSGPLRNRPSATIASKTAPGQRRSASSRVTAACELRPRPSTCSARRSPTRRRRARTVLGGLRGIAP